MSVSYWKSYLRYYRGNYKNLLAGVFFAMARPTLLLPMPLVIRHVFHEIIPTGNFSLLWIVGIGLILLQATSSGADLLSKKIIHRTSKSATMKMRLTMLEKLYRFPRDFYSEADRGVLHTQIVQDSERIDLLTCGLLGRLVPSMFSFFIFTLLLAFLNWVLTLVLAGCVPVIILLDRLTKNRMEKRVKKKHRAFERFSNGIWFVLRALDLTHARSAEKLEISRQGKHLDSLRQESESSEMIIAAYICLQNTVVVVVGIVILIIGGAYVAAGSMTLGELIAYYFTFALLRGDAQMIVWMYPRVVEGNESLRTIFNFLNAPHCHPYKGEKDISFQGNIRFENVTFGYNSKPVLKNVCMTLRPNSFNVVVGPNGSGKTSIIHLILGFYRPSEGHLYADDQPFEDLDISQLRRYIGYVPQDPVIFPGTISENIAYGFPNAHMAEIEQASRLATAHSFIESFEHGYDTLTGDEGILLSGGQCQRIAIARALIRKPKLLILDEPTNHLDAESVRHFLNNLEKMEGAPAILIVSHDLRLVEKADTIHELHNGKIRPREPERNPSAGLPLE